MNHFRLPAEFEKQEAILLSFPFEGNDWPGKFGAIQWEFTEFIRKVSYFEKVLLIVKSDEHGDKVKNMLDLAHADLRNIDFISLKTNRAWMRDSGPITVKTIDGKRIALQFSFTGWAKYPNHRLDQKIPQKIAEKLKIPSQKVFYKEKHVVLEGGAIDVNGKGTMLTTKECLLHPSIQIRNKGFDQKDYEAIFKEAFGITNTIWLNEGIDGDDTHGHVDDICRFVNPKTVVACEEKNTKDKNHKKLAENLEILAGSALENGDRIEVVKMPMPTPLYFDKMRLPASYVNFLIGNDFVLVPTFNDKNDYKALGILNELFPKREVIGINATHLVWGLGTLHCLSHEIPA
ncbi:MAG: agmatine deiminase family protein [Lutimonas sp.]